MSNAFAYTEEERRAISSAMRFETAHKQSPNDVDETIGRLQSAACRYVEWREASQRLPDRSRLAEHVQAEIDAKEEMVAAIIESIGVRGGRSEFLACLATDPRQVRDTRSILLRYEQGSINVLELEAAIAVNLIRSHRVRLAEHDHWLADRPKLRQVLFEEIVAEWIRLTGLPLTDLSITEGAKTTAGACFAFVDAASRPALRRVDEEIGGRSICNMVRSMKADPSQFLLLRIRTEEKTEPENLTFVS